MSDYPPMWQVLGEEQPAGVTPAGALFCLRKAKDITHLYPGAGKVTPEEYDQYLHQRFPQPRDKNLFIAMANDLSGKEYEPDFDAVKNAKSGTSIPTNTHYLTSGYGGPRWTGPEQTNRPNIVQRDVLE